MVSCREIAAIERQQPFPVPLGGVAIVNWPFRKCEAVMGAGIHLDLGMGVLHRRFHFLDDFRGGVNIGFGAAEIELGLGLARSEMWTVGLVGGQTGSVDRGRGLDPT